MALLPVSPTVDASHSPTQAVPPSEQTFQPNHQPLLDQGHRLENSHEAADVKELNHLQESGINPILAIASHQWFDRLFHSNTAMQSCQNVEPNGPSQNDFSSPMRSNMQRLSSHMQNGEYQRQHTTCLESSPNRVMPPTVETITFNNDLENVGTFPYRIAGQQNYRSPAVCFHSPTISNSLGYNSCYSKPEQLFRNFPSHEKPMPSHEEVYDVYEKKKAEARCETSMRKQATPSGYKDCKYDYYSPIASKYPDFGCTIEKTVMVGADQPIIHDSVFPTHWIFDHHGSIKMEAKVPLDCWRTEECLCETERFAQQQLTQHNHNLIINTRNSSQFNYYSCAMENYHQMDLHQDQSTNARCNHSIPYPYEHDVDAATAAAVAMATNFPYPILQPMSGFLPENQVSTSTLLAKSRFGANVTSRLISNSVDVNLPERNYNPRELEAFSELFKQRRIKLGVTQADVGKALGNLKIAGVGSLSQSTICRFESLTLSHNNMVALKPVLQAWLEEAEADAAERQRHPEVYDPDDERRRKRTSITDSEKRSLEAFFSVQPRPSSEKISQIAEKLNLKKNVVRVWFCNQRQKQKRMKFSTLGLLHHTSIRS